MLAEPFCPILPFLDTTFIYKHISLDKSEDISLVRFQLPLKSFLSWENTVVTLTKLDIYL
jgi:hypothetical protein